MSSDIGIGNEITYKLPSGQTPTYTNWGSQEPSIMGGCVAFQVRDTSLGQLELGKWSAVSCNYKNGYFCKKPTQPVPTTSPIAEYPGCPPVRNQNLK